MTSRRGLWAWWSRSSRWSPLQVGLVPFIAIIAVSARDANAQALTAPGNLAREPGMTLRFRSVFHAYQVRLYTDAVGTSTIGARNVNPLYMTLDAGGWSLGPNGNFDVVASIRYNTDFGTGFHRDTPNDGGIPAVDGRNDVDLSLLYVDWRNAIEGTLDLRLGRQVLLDDLDWYSLDGVKSTLHLARTATATIDAEVYVGMPVRIGRLFASEPFINDGFEISDGPGLTFGGAVFARLFDNLSLSGAYRQELVFRGDDIAVFRPRPTTAEETAEVEAVRRASAGKFALQESLIGGSAGYSFRAIDVDLFANIVWNLAFGALDLMRAGAAWNPERGLHLQAEVLHVYPRFAADSIFNIFNIFPYTRGRFEASWEIFPGFTAQAGYFLLLVTGGRSTSGGGPEFQGEDVAHGPSLGATYTTGDYTFGFVGEASTNFGGKYAFGGNYRRAELFGDASFLDDRFGAVLRLGLTTVQNDWFEGLTTGQVADPETSYTIDVGGRATLLDHIDLRLNFIKNFESYLEGDYRVLGVLEIRY